MTSQNPASEQTPIGSAVSPTIVAVMLIGLFAMRLLTPAHEYPMRAEQVMTMAFDAGMLVGLIAMRSRVSPALFWPAAIAGFGSFLIRFTSDAAWWTGHLIYFLQPR
jgi:hypothetical protein